MPTEGLAPSEPALLADPFPGLLTQKAGQGNGFADHSSTLLAVYTAFGHRRHQLPDNKPTEEHLKTDRQTDMQ